MEEKKLLFALILLSLVNFGTASSLDLEALDLKEFQAGSASAVEFAKSLSKEKEVVSPETAKWCSKLESEETNKISKSTKEWVTVLEQKSKHQVTCAQQARVDSFDDATNANLYVFVTLNMHKQNLKALIKEAKKYNAVLVIRGLKEDSMVETAKYLKDLIKDDLEGIVVDPYLFREYGIVKVPSFVFEQENQKIFDKLEGNISVRYALEKIAQRGDLKNQARKLLGKI